jgi:1,2-diacylglycerol 3-alpha-glucosyltransferase
MEQRSFARRLIPVLQKEQYDIVHTQDVELAAMLERNRLRGRIRTPTILAHGTDESMETLRQFRYLQHLSPEYQSRALEALGGVVVSADKCQGMHDDKQRSEVRDQSGRRREAGGGREEGEECGLPTIQNREPGFGKPRHLHFCIPNFVDTGCFVPWGSKVSARIRTGGFVIGCSAALDKRRKKVDVLVREAAELVRLGHDVRLLLAGAATDETPEIERLARAELGDRCAVLKDLPFDRMPEFYRALDLFVLPAPEEVFGICFLEAMACGVPVAAHASATLRWIVGDGGWNTDMRREGFMAGIWSEVIEGCRGRAVRARENVERRFSWEAVHPAFMAMYEAVGMDVRTNDLLH